MNSKYLFIAAVAALGISSGAMAQEKKNEVSLYGDISSTKTGSSKSDMTTIQVGYGVYLTPNWVAKVNYLLTDSSGAASSTYSDVGIGARYYFKVGKTGDVVPFAGAALNLIAVSSAGFSSTGTGTSLEGGVAIFVSESASIDLKIFSESSTINGTSSTRSGLNVGTTYRF